MTVSEFMSKIEIKSDFAGVTLADDYVLAINLNGHVADSDPGTYTVVEAGLKSTDGQLNPEEKTNSYIRKGKSTTKTGVQRSFSLDMDRYIGDEAQDFFDSYDVKYGTGQKCVVDYVFFNMLTGKGEKGMMSVIVNTDCSGGSEENSGLSVDLKSTGVKPAKYTWAAASGSSDSGAGTNEQNTDNTNTESGS